MAVGITVTPDDDQPGGARCITAGSGLPSPSGGAWRITAGSGRLPSPCGGMRPMAVRFSRLLSPRVGSPPLTMWRLVTYGGWICKRRRPRVPWPWARADITIEKLLNAFRREKIIIEKGNNLWTRHSLSFPAHLSRRAVSRLRIATHRARNARIERAQTLARHGNLRHYPRRSDKDDAAARFV
ncbi:hypothetical protein PR202_gb12558 [Eleusine coracana subsp. coracana]|uniref:Uncharacterized protein n=1 Tax=Eleusine coracana subsp. coracana TaxID=191504 RepID=A0AAV5EN62_ELECO|nr:hypothetical protein PR202_gb12558 [Eleusine coracana subsp. coracana]